MTGGAGFIGANLCRKLLAGGHRVICLDNFSSGRKENIEPLTDDLRFAWLEGDVAEPSVFRGLMKEGLTQIYHLACPASPRFYQRDPVATARTCFCGALNILDLAARLGARVLLASTSEVYGEPQIHPQPEEYRGNISCTGVRACYDEGKRISETLFFDHLRTRGTDVVVVRIFNTYGPYMRRDDGRVMSNFITEALAGEALPVYGDGSQTRSFCYISDLTEGLVRAMNQNGFRGPVNLGNPQEITIRDLARTIAALTGTDTGMKTLPLPQDDPTRRCPDISLAERVLNWKPQIALEDGIRKTLDYFRGEMRAE